MSELQRFSTPDDRRTTEPTVCREQTQNGTCSVWVDAPSEGVVCFHCERALCGEHSTELQNMLQCCPDHEVMAFEAFKAEGILERARRTQALAETIRFQAIQIETMRKLIELTKMGLAMGAAMPTPERAA